MQHFETATNLGSYGGAEKTPSKPIFQTMKESVANGIAKAANSLHEKAENALSPQFTGFGHQTANWLEKSADYVQQLEPEKMRADIESQVRRNPTKSLLIAGAVGLVLGAVFRRR
ncbi:MAG: hypothetical protein JST84_29545 [Acidobacteria bacterium]|nr:hypothetical protein [Acidobacteriota bacterium]